MKIIEHESNKYRNRTIHNAETADLTVAFAIDFNSAGEKLTKRAAGYKYVAIPLIDETLNSARILYKYCKKHNVKTLNIAGNSIHTISQYNLDQETVNQCIYDILKIVHLHYPIEKVISGGQTGVDLAGSIAAEALNIESVMTLPYGLIQKESDGKTITQKEEELLEKVNIFLNKLSL